MNHNDERLASDPDPYWPLLREWWRQSNNAICRSLDAYKEPAREAKGMRGMSRCTD